MQTIVTCGIAGVILGVSAGVAVGYHWGHKDGRRAMELEAAFDQGMEDRRQCIEIRYCPYESDPEMQRQWELGWMDVEMDGRERLTDMIRERYEQG